MIDYQPIDYSQIAAEVGGGGGGTGGASGSGGASAGLLPPPPYQEPTAAAPTSAPPPLARQNGKTVNTAVPAAQEKPVAPVALAPAPAAPNPKQMPVPTRQNLGAPPAPNYDMVMNVINGPIKPAQNFVDDWNSPENMKAAKTFEWALMANFTGAAAQGGNGLTNFFAQNPHAYMLGESTNRISEILREQALKNGATDYEAEQYAGWTNVMNGALLMQGMANEAAGKPFGFTKEKAAWLKGTFAPALDQMPVRGRNLLMKQSAAFLPHITQTLNAMANDRQAEATYGNMVVNQQNQKQKEREWNDVGYQQGLATTKEIQSRTQQYVANSKLIDQQTGWYGRTQAADIRYKDAAAQYSAAQATGYPVMLRTEQMKTEEQMWANHVAILELSANNALSQINISQAKLTALGGGATRSATKADVADGKAVAEGQSIPTEDAVRLKTQIEQDMKTFSDINNEVIARKKDSYERFKDTGSPEFKTLSISPLLKLAAQNGKYELSQLYADVNANHDASTRNLFYPKGPQVWDAEHNYFIPATNVAATDILPASVVQDLIKQTVEDPGRLQALREGKIMSSDDYLRLVRTPAQAQGIPMAQTTYIHYVMLMNYLKQTDWLMHTYKSALASGMPLNEVTNEDDPNPLHVPTPAETAPSAGGKPRTKGKKPSSFDQGKLFRGGK